MRVTTNTFPNRLLSQLGDLAARQSKLQTQAATGQRVQAPEDDPEAMRQVLEMQAENSALKQYSDNIANLKETTTAAYSSIKSLKSINTYVGETIIKVGGVTSDIDMEHMAADIDEQLAQAVTDANATFKGDYLFAGTKGDKPPFEVVKDANGRITAVNYVGNSSALTAEISPNVTSEAQPVGANTTGAGPRGLITDSASGADYFNHLIQLRDHLLAHDKTAVTTTDLSNNKKDEENLLYHYSHIGAIQSRLDAADSIVKDQSFQLDQHVSGLVDADLAQTLVRLTQVQNAYTAALQTGGSILNSSLLDYLH